ncbi:MAG: 4'-phosphopantetheinyl transferase superfamily protein [Pricia sp.]
MNEARSESTFELPENEVHLWHCRFDANKDNIEAFKRILSEDEIEKARRFKFDIHREQSIISRGVLRTLLGKYLNQHPRDLLFDYTEYDKPFLRGNGNLQFNVSHSGNRALFGFVQNAEIGVDIEKIKSDFEVIDIAQNFFSSDEIRTLQAMPESEKVAGFFRCWTRKESFIKAKGSGLSFALTSFSVSLDVDSPSLLRTDWTAMEKGEGGLFSFTPEEGYLGALSIRGTINKVQEFNWQTLNRAF